LWLIHLSLRILIEIVENGLETVILGGQVPHVVAKLLLVDLVKTILQGLGKW